MDPATVLTENEEARLKEWVLNLARKGYPIHRSIQGYSKKKSLMNRRETIFNNNRPGLTWWMGFKKRHPRIAEKEVESLTKARAAVTEDAIRKWFEEVEVMLKPRILGRLSRPESGIQR